MLANKKNPSAQQLIHSSYEWKMLAKEDQERVSTYLTSKFGFLAEECPEIWNDNRDPITLHIARNFRLTDLAPPSEAAPRPLDDSSDDDSSDDDSPPLRSSTEINTQKTKGLIGLILLKKYEFVLSLLLSDQGGIANRNAIFNLKKAVGSPRRCKTPDVSTNFLM